jgi:hypothetical protein
MLEMALRMRLGMSKFYLPVHLVIWVEGREENR